jgi:hypothetical protein
MEPKPYQQTVLDTFDRYLEELVTFRAYSGRCGQAIPFDVGT